MAEADDFHSDENKAKMASGQPLNDEDRLPWLQSLRAKLVAWNQQGLHGVFTCSALKRSYRRLLQGRPSDLETSPSTESNSACDVVIVLVTASEETLRTRMTRRSGHFMPPSMLPSQLNVIEMPGADEDEVLEMNTEGLTIDQVISRLFDIVSEKSQ